MTYGKPRSCGIKEEKKEEEEVTLNHKTKTVRVNFFYLLFFCFNVQAVQLLRPGGCLVYSTCTLLTQENEEQVAWTLKTFPELKLVEQVRCQILAIIFNMNRKIAETISISHTGLLFGLIMVY